MDAAAAAALADLIRSGKERLTATAVGVVEVSPEMRGRLSHDDIEQLVNGFCELLLEALAENGGQARTLFLETAAPALVADGQTSASIARAATAFGVAISCDLGQQADDDRRAATTAWLASFFGDYLHDLVVAAERAA